MGIVVLGVSAVKIGRRRRFGYFGGGELETTDLGSGTGGTPKCTPTVTVFGAYVLGFYLRLEDMSSPRSETEWINLSIGHRAHHPAESGDRAELSSVSAEPYLLRMDSGVSVGERWR
jgi:hypothetical protein